MATVLDRLFPVLVKLAPFLYRILSKLERAPFYIQLEPTSRCNLRCPMCTRTLSTKPPRDMRFEELERIACTVLNAHSWAVRELLPRLIMFDLTGLGEAMLNPRFVDMVEALKRHGLSVSLSDNFTLMSDAHARRLIQAGVDIIFVSFDGSCKRTYEKLRKGARFEDTLAHIDRFVELRKELGARKPRLVMRSLVMSENVEELPRIVELAAEHGITCVSFDHLNTHPLTRHLKASHPAYETARARAKETARELGVTLNCAPYPKQPYTRCARPFHSVNITAEGDILPCCFANEEKHYSELGEYSLGNAFEEDVVKVWRSERYRRFRRLLSRGEPPEFCTDCYLFSVNGQMR